MLIRIGLFAFWLLSFSEAFRKCLYDGDCPAGTVCQETRNLCIVSSKLARIATQPNNTQTTTINTLDSAHVPDKKEDRILAYDPGSNAVYLSASSLSFGSYFQTLILAALSILLVPIAIVVGVIFLILSIPFTVFYSGFSLFFNTFEGAQLGRNIDVDTVKDVFRSVVKGVKKYQELQREAEDRS